METQATISERRAVYDPAAIEPKWQQRWESDGLHRARIDPERKKHYFLTMLPYPSGDLHIGHWYAMTPSDARARYLRMQGYNVMYPIGFDSFGLPAENAAIKRNIHPKEWTYANIDRMRGQLRSMGAMWDWQREATSSDRAYYRWTQWFFVKLLAHDLAYRSHAAVDFCPNCNTTVAREQVVGEERLCERCDTPVIKRDLEQWFLRITRYAEELLRFDGIDWPERIRTLQTNWIGRSEGAHVAFRTERGDALEVFTTRPDTLWGATFMVLAPEHPLVAKLTTPARRAEVEAYVASATRQTDIEREAAGRDKSGAFTGAYAVNPVNDENIPIWIADYVLMTYGTGAIMAVPAHDERDFAFARAYGLTVRPVIQPDGTAALDGGTMTEAVIANGAMIDSGPLTGTPAVEAIARTIAWLGERGIGRAEVVYRLHDWLISRQRYWGCPIPVVHCQRCGIVPVPEEQLPVELPDDVEWRPTGESPLKFHPTWRNTACPRCGQPAERETDTMDTFMCSSWYHLRYLSPDCSDGPFDSDEYRYWMPVDTYTGGAEHATMHLMYTRFFHKANRDMGIETGAEPMLQLRNQGQILAADGARMSKSRGNTTDPDELVARHGADAVRAFLMFGYRWSEGGPWNDGNIHGVVRWLGRVWDLVQSNKQALIDGKVLTSGPVGVARTEFEQAERQLRRIVHQTIRAVSGDFERFDFNTVVSALMQLTSTLVSLQYQIDKTGVTKEFKIGVFTLLKLMAPVTPHIAEELWEQLKKQYSIHRQEWPSFSAEAAAEDVITLVVQVNGKMRGKVEVPAAIDQSDAERLALKITNVARAVDDAKQLRMPRQAATPEQTEFVATLSILEPVEHRVIYVADRLINFVV